MLNSGVTVQTSLFGMTPETPATIKGWRLEQHDVNRAVAVNLKTRERFNIYRYESGSLFSDEPTWDFPAELPEPVRRAAVELLSPALELPSEPEPDTVKLMNVSIKVSAHEVKTAPCGLRTETWEGRVVTDHRTNKLHPLAPGTAVKVAKNSYPDTPGTMYLRPLEFPSK